MGAKWGAAMTKDDSLKLALDASYDDDDTQTYQRPWVGLTTDEKQEWIDAMPDNLQPRHLMNLVNVIESTLQSKNT